MAEELLLTFLDVQHGSACHIVTPSGKHILFDLGTGDFDDSQDGESHSPIKYLKHHFGVNQVDGVFITHPHEDHISDIFNFDAVSPIALYRPKHLSEEAIRAGNRSIHSPKIDKYFEIDRRYNAQFAPGTSPFSTDVNRCVQFDVFGAKNCSETNLNNHSLLAVVTFADTKILMTGDQEGEAWEELLGQNAFIEAIKGTDILLASHHGRENGFHDDLFSYMGNPSLTIISDGPVGTTCARDKYAAKTKGWSVHSRSGVKETEKRRCLTTRTDGTIIVRCTPGYRTVYRS